MTNRVRSWSGAANAAERGLDSVEALLGTEPDGTIDFVIKINALPDKILKGSCPLQPLTSWGTCEPKCGRDRWSRRFATLTWPRPL